MNLLALLTHADLFGPLSEKSKARLVENTIKDIDGFKPEYLRKRVVP